MSFRFKVKENETDNILFLGTAEAAALIGGGGGGVDQVARDAATTAQSTADTNTTAIATINADNATQTELDTAVASLQAGINANTTDIATNSTNITANAAAITAINADNATQTELDAVQNTLQTQITANGTAATNAQNTADSNTANIATNATAIAAINSDNATQTELDAVQTSLQTGINTNSTNIATNTAAIAAIGTGIPNKLLASDSNATAGEAITDLQPVSLVPASDPPVYVLADASSETTVVDGFAAGTTANGQPLDVWVPGGIIPGFSGLVTKQRYYLSKTAGGMVTSLAGYLIGEVAQYLGTAYSPTHFGYFPDDYNILEVDL